MNTTDLHNLPLVDKLKLVTQLWDEIATSSEPIVVPDEILTEAQKRSKELRLNPEIGIDDKELWRRVNG